MLTKQENKLWYYFKEVSGDDIICRWICPDCIFNSVPRSRIVPGSEGRAEPSFKVMCNECERKTK